MLKEVVWDCDSFKSPGPDSVNFGFCKDFWLDMKSYIMHFLVEFHRNGKLSRRIDSTLLLPFQKLTTLKNCMIFVPFPWWGAFIKFWRRYLLTDYVQRLVLLYRKNNQLLFKIDNF